MVPGVGLDLQVAAVLRRSLYMQDSELLTPDPAVAKADAEIGRTLGACVIFKESPVPDFRHGPREEGGTDVQNLARYELYIKRLAAEGIDPMVQARRVGKGLRVQAQIKAWRAKFMDQDRNVVHRLKLVV